MSAVAAVEWSRSNRLGIAVWSHAATRGDDALSASLNSRFVAGDPEAIRELYRELGGPLYGAVYRIVNDHSLAEEAVQQAFLKAWRACDRFDARRDIAPWLFTIAKRTALDIYRRERRRTGEDLDHHDVGVDPVGMETTYAIFEVRRALQDLPDDEREILALTHFAGLSHSQAAAKLDIPLGTVKSRAHRAYRRLEQLLDHMRDPET